MDDTQNIPTDLGTYPKKLTFPMLEELWNNVLKGPDANDATVSVTLPKLPPLPPEAYEHVWKKAVPGYLYGYRPGWGKFSFLTGCGGVHDMCDAMARAGLPLDFIENAIVVHVGNKMFELLRDDEKKAKPPLTIPSDDVAPAV